MPSPPASEQGRRFFIASGTIKYANFGEDMDLPSVAGDLDRISKLFLSQGCIRALPTIDRNPDLADIRDKLPAWMQGEVTENDVVAFYYSGHGIVDDRYYLLLQNSTVGLFDTTAIPVEELARWLMKNAAARQIVVIIDACYSARGSDDFVLIAARLANMLASSPGVFAIAAAGGKDEAQEGSFSEAFCDALANRDGGLGWRTQPYIFAEALIEAVNTRLAGAKLHQRARLVSSIGEGCKLFRNPQYQPSVPSDLDLQAQRDLLEHWIPKARGAEIAGDSAWYFTGRQRALSEIVGWLDSPDGDTRPRIVTGRPGVGKSALVSRLVTLSNATTRAEAIRSVAGAAGTIPAEGSVNVTIHARQCTLEKMVDLVATRTGIEADDAATLVTRIGRRGRTVIAVDAVDEAIEPARIMARLLRPLSELPNVRLLVAMRPDASNGRVTAFGNDVAEIDLSSPGYFESGDVLSYARQRLESGNGAIDAPAREKLASEISRKAGNVFLIARILCDSALLELGQGRSPQPAAQSEASTVAAAFAEYLTRLDAIPEFGAIRAIDLLKPLAFAEGEGLPWEAIWPALASALSGQDYFDPDIRALFTHAGAYIVESNSEGRSVYRLYHEALAEYFRGLSDQAAAQRSIVTALVGLIPTLPDTAAKDWSTAHPYTLRHLATHAARAGQLETLLNDTDFLLHSRPQTLAPALRELPPAAGRAAAYLRAYPHMRQEDLPTRVEYLALSAALFNCGDLLHDLKQRNAACEWFPCAAWYRDTGSHVIASVPDFTTACLVHSPDKIVRLALLTNDRVSILSLSTGEALDSFYFDGKQVSSAIELPRIGEIVLALAFENGEIGVLDVTRRALSRVKAAARAPIIGTIGTGVDQMLITGDEDGAIGIWSVPKLHRVATIKAHKAAITFFATATVLGKEVLITGSDAYKSGEITEKRQLRVWDAKTFKPLQAFTGPKGGRVDWMGALEMEDKTYLAAYYTPRSTYVLHALKTGKNVTVLDDVHSRPFGLWKDSDSAVLLSGFSDAFRWVHVAKDSGRSIVMEATANMTVEGGQWLGPIEARDSRTVVSVGNNVRVWDLQRLQDRAKAVVEAKVGLLDEAGEPLFCLSAPSDSAYFAGLSRYGNLRIWDADGRCVVLKQVVTSLDGSGAREFDYLQMVDFGGTCLYATAGRSGAAQAWRIDGEPMSPRLEIETDYAAAFYVHSAGKRLLALVAAREGNGYQVSAWDLLRGTEITTAGRFELEGYEDKTIDHLVAVAVDGQTIIVGALGHSGYYRICAWDLDSPPVDERRQKLRAMHGLPPRPRNTLWTSVVDRQIKCLSVVRYRGSPAIAIGDINGWITILRASSGEVLISYKAHEKEVVALGMTRVGGQDTVVSAGLEGGIVVAGSSNRADESGRRIHIDVGDRIRSMAAISGGRVVIGTEEGFLMFELTGSRDAIPSPH